MKALSRRSAVAVAIAVAGIDGALLWPGAASASGPAAFGGWRIERQATPAGAVPSNPLTDDGSLAVRNGPAGVLAFAAVRFEGSGGLLSLTLSSDPPPTMPAVEACRVTSSWSAGADQSWDSRPTYDCAHHASATVSGSQLSWQLDSAFSDGGVLDVALVPDPADTTPFAVSLALPNAASFQPDDDRSTTGLPPPAADPPQASGGEGPPPLGVPAAPGVDPRSVAAPVVAPSATSAAPQIADAPAAATREPGSRAAGAGALAAFAFILLVRSFVVGGSGGRAPRSLLLVNRGGS